MDKAYPHLLATHNVLRWPAVVFVLLALVLAWHGVSNQKKFTGTNKLVNLLALVFVHLQLLFGLILYAIGPNGIKAIGAAGGSFEALFYSVLHAVGMITVAVLITIGYGRSKRAKKDEHKHRHILKHYGYSIVLMLILVPWPFSPLANRPYFRPFS